MDTAVLQQTPEEASDHAVVHHGHTDCTRDDEVVVSGAADPVPASRRPTCGIPSGADPAPAAVIGYAALNAQTTTTG
ncbi:hypothetical protein [Streptomyces sp. NPDC088915]|uniref:YxiG-like protein n=1 Tax=Streptomyces sp. NPDC088915 TaxID=3365912 RepID=UPI00381FE2DE